ncbi:PaaI family thioesterase [Endozoicomonas sp.]|uniref:PaaI family thioesterase n=1 Tax=Endozoicomonas sp. TaxID=1892382 RepID=UPI00383BD2D7
MIINALGEKDDTSPHQKKLKLVQLLRSINDQLVSSDLSEEAMAEACKQLELTHVRLSGFSERAYQAVFAPSDDGESAELGYNAKTLQGLYTPVSGCCNAVASEVTYFTETSEAHDPVVAHVCYGKAFEGGPGLVHGGFIAALFDELFGVVQHRQELPSMTGSLSLRYLKPTPLHTELRYEAWVVETRGRKSTMKAVLKNGDDVLVEADALFVTVLRKNYQKLVDQRVAVAKGGS